MTTSERDRALKLLEKEDRRSEEIAARRTEQEQESRLQGAIKRIRESDRKQRIAQAEKEAEFQAQYLAQQRYEVAEQLEATAAHFNRLLSEYQSVHRRHLDALREAGHPPGHSFNLQEVVIGWFRHRFGGWNSLTGTPAPFHGAQDLPLPERDYLASPGSNTDKEAG